jgi:hypothetical protein
VSPVRYELGFYIPEDGILYSHRRKTSNLPLPILSYHAELAELPQCSAVARTPRVPPWPSRQNLLPLNYRTQDSVST